HEEPYWLHDHCPRAMRGGTGVGPDHAFDVDEERSWVEDRLAVGLQVQLAPALTQYRFRTGADCPDTEFLRTSASFRTGRANRRWEGTVKPLVKFVALAVITIAPNAGAHAQTAAPATASPPGT